MAGGKKEEVLRTFELQNNLPTLPVPPLAGTLAAYLTSVEGLLSGNELAATRRAVAEFGKPGGEGEELQAQLVARAAGVVGNTGPLEVGPEDHPDGSAYPECHWLESWWEKYAYLSDRTSLAVNVNCFQTHFRARPCAQPLLRLAWSLKGALDCKRLLAEGLVPPERAGRAVFCSAQYLRVFSTTRVPGEECDTLVTYSKTAHFCVERRGHWYAVHAAELLSVADLHAQLALIKADADARAPGPGLAALTGTDRAVWARARLRLRAAGAGNAAALELLESALFHVVLSEETPQTPSDVMRLGQTGGGEHIWFDKSVTHVLFDNGALVSNLEHTSADAVVPARVYVYLDEFVAVNAPPEAGVGYQAGDHYVEGVSGIPVTRYDDAAAADATAAFNTAKPAAQATQATQPTQPKQQQRRRAKAWGLCRVDFALDAASLADVASAKAELGTIVADNIVECLQLDDFGGASIASKCKGISTDSFAQMSLALAYYRDQSGELPVAYETATTRSFFHGRTETIRPQSALMTAFLRAFDDGAAAPADVAALVRAAGDHHRDYLRRCMAGNGVDRHLMGLRLLAAEAGRPAPAMFEDKAYPLSTTFTLSTSQMPFAVQDWPGFGAYDPNAYAVCYRFTGDDKIVANVASRNNGNGKDARRFSEAIKTAMRDVFRVLSENPPAPKAPKAPKSKL